MTFSALEDGNKLNDIATDLSVQLKALTDALVAQGKHVTILVTEQDDEGEFAYAVVSTIDDHEELMTMVDAVSDDLLAPYAESLGEDDQPELPFKAETIQ
ncbi:hypothetical protein G6L16_008965 [Agrobacterium tumefaciens]|uniref:hypothetical protein n=1 Tax=Agrobacterium tumefaciens TaxID=358 RepID=UPI0015732D6E|nr:hypothetical protein [Agrobacterium tumefaciens]NSZ63469.1 hypothetical protein [Agrobacterium tumefaciens]NTA69839.1 hypothetical protein [Agrobacterium tumefaciens]WIE36984.1 hypothetical protein G6L16_008965 [Agrobacterium tumefaciens]